MNKLLKFFLSAAVVCALVAPTAPIVAQRGSGSTAAADAGPFGALRWRNVGPPRGGRSIAVAGSVARPNEYYMGATGGGLWKAIAVAAAFFVAATVWNTYRLRRRARDARGKSSEQTGQP